LPGAKQALKGETTDTVNALVVEFGVVKVSGAPTTVKGARLAGGSCCCPWKLRWNEEKLRRCCSRKAWSGLWSSRSWAEVHKTVVKGGELLVETSVAVVVAVRADAEKLVTTVGVDVAAKVPP
jgi:hypothetical protein